MSSNCRLDDVFISTGKMVSSFSGLFNGLVNGAFRILVDETDQNELKAALAAIGDTQGDIDLGVAFGTIFKKFFQIEVPSYQYKDFQRS